MSQFAVDTSKEISLALDTHVHIYPTFDPASALDSAWLNLTQIIRDHHLENAVPAFIWSRFARETDLYQLLTAHAAECGGWYADPAETTSVGFWAQHTDGKRLFIFLGSQLVSQEGLEVLLAGAYEAHFQGKPVADIITHYGNTHLVILPWGVGKWMGQRGRLVEELVCGTLNGKFVLGDNSSRPAFWSPIRAFIKAERNQHKKVCPGTDPLPIKGQEQRIGQSGIVLEHLPADIFTSSDILPRALKTGSNQFKSGFDRREHPLRFFLNQLKIRLS